MSAVGPDKQRRLIRLAGAYVKKRRLGRPPVRFDIVGVLFGSQTPRNQRGSAALLTLLPKRPRAGFFDKIRRICYKYKATRAGGD